MSTKKKTKSTPRRQASEAALPPHDGTDNVDRAAEDGHAARMATMAPDSETEVAGQTATVSG